MNPITEALDLLRRDGWAHMSTDRWLAGLRCAADAVLAAQPELQSYELYTNPAALIVDAVAREQFPERFVRFGRELGADCPVWPFNDDPRTTFADVEAVMEKAAVRFDERVQ